MQGEFNLGEFNLAGVLPASSLLGSVRPVVRGTLHCNGFAGRIADSPRSYGKKATWETIIVTSRNYICGKCDKYCHGATVGIGATTRYGMEWRSACTIGMARGRPISDGHFPLVGAEDGAHHVGDLAERRVDDRGVSALAPLSTSPPTSTDPSWPVHGQDRDTRDTE